MCMKILGYSKILNISRILNAYLVICMGRKTILLDSHITYGGQKGP